MLLAHAGHAHGHDMGTHGHAMSAPATANTKVSSTLSVSACWIRSLPAPAPSAGYFLIKNTGSKSAKLQSASSATYGMVMLHQTTHQDGKIGRAHVGTPVTNAQLVCRLLLEKKNKQKTQ